MHKIVPGRTHLGYLEVWRYFRRPVALELAPGRPLRKTGVIGLPTKFEAIHAPEKCLYSLMIRRQG